MVNDRYVTVSVDKVKEHTVRIIVLDKETGELKETNFK